jgi:hypothetical protein
MIVAYSQAKKKTQAKNAAIGCAVVAAILAVTKLAQPDASDARVAVVDNERHYVHSKMRVVGEYLAKNHSGETILLLSMPPSEDSPEQRQAAMDGLKEGLAGKATIAAERHPENPDKTSTVQMSYQYFFNAKSVDAIMDAHKDCTLMLSLIGLPDDFEKMEFWGQSDSDRHKMVLLNANIYNLGRAIQGDFVTAVVAAKPGVRFDFTEKAPSDHNEAFNKRYLIVDKANFTEVTAQHPKLFKAEQ